MTLGDLNRRRAVRMMSPRAGPARMRKCPCGKSLRQDADGKYKCHDVIAGKSAPTAPTPWSG